MQFDDETERDMEIAEHCGSDLILASICCLSGFLVGVGLTLLATNLM